MSADTHASLWMCLYFKKLPLEVFSREEQYQQQYQQQYQLETQQKDHYPAIVVLDKQVVFCMNDMASEIGIKKGNNIDTTYALSDATLGNRLISFKRDEDKENKTLAHLAQWAYQFTPNVSISAPDCLLLDIHACLKLFKGLDNLSNKVEQGLDKLGYQAFISINKTPMAALLTAHAQGFQATNQNNKRYQSYKSYNADIRQISVQYLAFEKSIIVALKQMGIYKLDALLALPNSGLTRRFGAHFTDYIQRLTGAKADPRKFISPKVIFSSEINFLFDLTNLNSLLFPMRRLLNELSDFLNIRQLHINHFTWHLSHRHRHDRKSIHISLANPANNAQLFLILTRLKLEQINDLREIDKLVLIADQFLPVTTMSTDLFQDTDSIDDLGLISVRPNGDIKDPAKKNLLLDMLNAKLGSERYFGLSQANDHRPEKAWKKVSLNKAVYWSPENQDTPPRPVFLLSRPRALAITNKQMTNKQRPWPENFTLLKGPERIDYGWWDHALDKILTRDYYVAQQKVARQKNTGLYWVFQDIATERWYLHGVFS